MQTTRTARALTLIAASLALAAFDCRALTIGLHLNSVHMPQRDQRNDNWGAYALNSTGQIAGCYRNSHDRTTTYAGQTFPVGPVAAGLVLATGYDERCNASGVCRGFAKHKVTPLAAITYAPSSTFMGVRPRLWVAPGFGKASTVAHLSLETEF